MAIETEAEKLAGALLSEIGQSVLDQTGGDLYRAGQPLLGDPSVEPAPADSPPVPETEAATEEVPAEPAAEAEAPRDEKGRFTKSEPEPEWFLPGLYKTRDEAIKGIHETKRYASEAVDAKRATAAELEALKTPPAPPPDALADLENYGLPKEVMGKAISEGARKAVQQMLEPMAKRVEADRQIISMYPDYQNSFDNLITFVEAQPELKQKVERAEAAGEFLLARELAWLNFERHTATKTTAAITSAKESRVEKAKATMADAAVTKPSQAEGRTRPSIQSPNDIPDEKFGDLMEMAKAGYPSPLWRSTIGNVLEREYPEVFGPQTR